MMATTSLFNRFSVANATCRRFAASRTFSSAPLQVDEAEEAWKHALMPAVQSLAKDEKGKLYALNLHKLKATPEYPEDYDGERFATSAEGFDAFATKGTDQVKALGVGSPIFVGAQTPGMLVMKREGMTFEGFESMALMEWNSAAAMTKGEWLSTSPTVWARTNSSHRRQDCRQLLRVTWMMPLCIAALAWNKAPGCAFLRLNLMLMLTSIGHTSQLRSRMWSIPWRRTSSW